MMRHYRFIITTWMAWVVSTCGCGYAEMPREMLVDAYNNYIAGEKADTIANRKEYFNQALFFYTKLDSIYHPTYGNGKLYYNIANSYFQVEEYPWAVLYYNRALKLMPREDRVKNNLEITKQKLSLSIPESTSPYQPFFFFHHNYSLPERLQAVFNFSILLLALITAYVMRPHKYVSRLIFLVGFCWLVMLMSVGYTRYLAPIEGILIRSTALSRDAGDQYAKVSEQPVLEGNKVQVLEVLKDGEWLKILTPTGELGYVPNTSIRII